MKSCRSFDLLLGISLNASFCFLNSVQRWFCTVMVFQFLPFSSQLYRDVPQYFYSCTPSLVLVIRNTIRFIDVITPAGYNFRRLDMQSQINRSQYDIRVLFCADEKLNTNNFRGVLKSHRYLHSKRKKPSIPTF